MYNITTWKITEMLQKCHERVSWLKWFAEIRCERYKEFNYRKINRMTWQLHMLQIFSGCYMFLITNITHSVHTCIYYSLNETTDKVLKYNYVSAKILYENFNNTERTVCFILYKIIIRLYFSWKHIIKLLALQISYAFS